MNAMSTRDKAGLQSGLGDAACFGTPKPDHISNLRERRFLQALLHRVSVSRHDLDAIIGAENSPDIAFRLRQRGYSLPCVRRKLLDRDGNQCRSGFYSLTDKDRALAIEALRAIANG